MAASTSHRLTQCLRRRRSNNDEENEDAFATAPIALSFRSNTLFIISTVGIGLFTDLFLYGLVVPVLPFLLHDRIGLPTSQIQSHVSGLLAAYAGAAVLFSPVAGLVADKTSTRRAPFLVGLVALLLATGMLFVGRTVAVLALARVLQGMSAAFVWTIGLALCMDTVGAENLGKTIGSIFSFVSVGSLVAPVLGGVLYEKAGYAGVFGIGFAMIALDLIMRLLVVEKREAVKYKTCDDISGDDGSNHMDTEVNGEEGEHQPDEESPLLGDQSNGTSDQSDEYYMPPDLGGLIGRVPLLYCFRNPRLLIALLIAFMQSVLITSFDATVPIVAQELFNFNSTKAGLLFIPLSVFDMLLGPVFGWAIDRYGTKPVATIGFTFLTPVFVLLRLPHSVPESASPKNQVILYAAILAVCGIGMASIAAPSVVEAGAIVERYHKRNPQAFGPHGPYAQMYGMNSMVVSAGMSLGPLIAGGLKGLLGYGNMNAVLAASCAVTAVTSAVWIGGRARWKGGRFVTEG